ncbi:MAG: sigma-70 family RNA polymerase sigma factor [Oscillospiraceae bacterium]|nr:sigma-70 family RNA polymerase sigma factor [Oscillospiraceae bacterium]
MEDAKIIELYWARNEDAIAQTDAEYGRRLHTLANRLLQDHEDAEESVSDTYMKTWNAIPPSRPAHFYAFLASICRHLSLNKLDWKQAAKRKAEVVFLTQEMELCIPDTSRDRAMEGKEIGKSLNRFLESLPRESRLIFLRRYWYVDTIAEIAQRYGMTESKVKMQLSRTKDKLRRHLEREGITV